MAIEKELLDQLLAGRDPQELFARDGLVDELKKALSERILNTELDEHLAAKGRKVREITATALRRNRRCCTDHPPSDIDAFCFLQDVVDAAQIQRRSSR